MEEKKDRDRKNEWKRRKNKIQQPKVNWICCIRVLLYMLSAYFASVFFHLHICYDLQSDISFKNISKIDWAAMNSKKRISQTHTHTCTVVLISSDKYGIHSAYLFSSEFFFLSFFFAIYNDYVLKIDLFLRLFHSIYSLYVIECDMNMMSFNIIFCSTFSFSFYLL